MKNKSKRIDWIDTLKGLSFFFVIWGHTFPSSKGGIKKYIYSFHMPLFFFASGLTFNNNCELSFKDYVKKKFKSLVIPYVIINIICILINYIFVLLNIVDSFSLIKSFLGMTYSNNAIIPFAKGAGPTWFILTLFLVEIVFYGIKKIIKDDIKLCNTIAILGLIGYVNSISEYQIRGPWHIEAFFTGIVFYYFGYLFMKYLPKFKSFFDDKIRLLLYGFTLGCLGCYIAYINRRVSMDGNLYGSIILFYVGALCTIFALIMFVNLILKKSFIFREIGKKSMFYLGYHEVLINLIAFLYPKSCVNNINIFITSIIVTIILFPLSFIVYKYCPFLIGKLSNKFYKLISKFKCDKISV